MSIREFISLSVLHIALYIVFSASFFAATRISKFEADRWLNCTEYFFQISLN